MLTVARRLDKELLFILLIIIPIRRIVLLDTDSISCCKSDGLKQNEDELSTVVVFGVFEINIPIHLDNTDVFFGAGGGVKLESICQW